MHLQWLLLFLSMVAASVAANNSTTSKSPNNISKPGCPQKCGNLTVPYPFGIGPKCAMNSNGAWFSIRCDPSHNPPKAFPTIPLGSQEDLEILDINENQLVIRNSNSQIASRCYDPKGNVTLDLSAAFDVAASPFTYSTANKLTVIGCDDYALATSSWGTTSRGNKQGYSVGCLALCSDPSELTRGSCSGLGCCQTSIPIGLQSFVITLSSLKNHTGPPEVASFQPCGYAFLAGGDRFRFGGASDFVGNTVVNRTRDGVPLVLDWVAGSFNSTIGKSDTCKGAKKDQSTYACQANSQCVDFYRGGYHCKCVSGYKGNPYLEPGCTG